MDAMNPVMRSRLPGFAKFSLEGSLATSGSSAVAVVCAVSRKYGYSGPPIVQVCGLYHKSLRA
jgi:hypothetical protein